MTTDLDVRDLPPPEPMLRILEAVTFLHPGESLRVIHNRVPHPLYPRLRERGLLVETLEHGDNDEIHLVIHRPA
ncbi:MAG: DUF2249 domain-containing protein [Magnetococcales bacterium]|nr:DUF2249 domain-containing protein [Magnetococcales bacterium]